MPIKVINENGKPIKKMTTEEIESFTADMQKYFASFGESAEEIPKRFDTLNKVLADMPRIEPREKRYNKRRRNRRRRYSQNGRP